MREKVASLRSDSVNVFDNENVFESVNVSVGIGEQPSIVVPLITLKFPKLSLWYDENVITDVETLEKAFS